MRTSTRPGIIGLISCTVLGATGYSSYLGLPMLLGALTGGKGLTEYQTGWLGSIELLGLLVGSLLTGPLISRMSGKLLGLIAALIAMSAQLATIPAEGFDHILVARLITGIGGGICYSLALARLASFANPTRSFSIFGIIVICLGSIELVILPWVAARFGLDGVLVALAFGHVAGALVTPGLPAQGQQAEMSAQASETAASNAPNSVEERQRMLRAGYVALFATFTYAIGATSFWAYVERLGVLGGLSSQAVGWALNIANLGGIATCMLVWRIERRWGQLGPQLFVLSTVALIFATWPIRDAGDSYAIRAFLYFQLLTISQILQNALLATTDPTGRQVALVPAAHGAGYALGPIFGASILAAGISFQVKLVAEAALLLVTAGLLALVYRMIGNATRPRRAEGMSPTDWPAGVV